MAISINGEEAGSEMAKSVIADAVVMDCSKEKEKIPKENSSNW